MNLDICYLLIFSTLFVVTQNNCMVGGGNCASCTNTYDCAVCYDGFGLYFNGAWACQSCVANCRLCNSDSSSCSFCQWGYRLNGGGGCEQCLTPYCARCNADAYTCNSCFLHWRLTAALDCESCTEQNNCQMCPNSPSTCTNCRLGFGVSNGSCIHCVDANCISCNANAYDCTQCSAGSGPWGGVCVACNNTYCLSCSFDSTRCAVCATGSGLAGTTCLSCVYGDCVECLTTNYYFCTRCRSGYTNNTSGGCDACTVAYCDLCPTSVSVCTSCVPGYGMNGSVCATCQYPCIACRGTSASACLSCQDPYFYDGSGCQPCMTNCLSCLDGVTCQRCSTTFYLDGGTLQCVACPDNCTECVWDSGSSSPTCTACQIHHGLSLTFPKTCPQICGDFGAYATACDDQTGVEYDGCTDFCEVEYGFVCTKTNFSSICSYENHTQMSIISIIRDQGANSFTMKVSIWPPLYVFRTSELKAVFKINDPIFTITSVTFDYPASQLTFKVDFSENFIDQQIVLQFVPDPSVDLRYFASVTSEASYMTKLFHYSAFTLASSQVSFYLCYAIVGIAILNTLMGIGAKRVVGLQSIIVCQIGMLSMVLLQSYLLSPFSATIMLKFTTGAHIDIFSPAPTSRLLQLAQTPTQFVGPPHMTSYNFNSILLSNNFNIFFALQALSTLCYGLVVISIKCMLLNINKLKQQDDHEGVTVLSDRVAHANKAKEVTAQLMMNFGMFNLAYFTFCVVIFFKGSSQIQITSLVVLGITAILYLLTFLAFYIDPDPFDYFRYSFRKQPLAMNFYFFYPLFVVSTTVLLALLTQVWPSLIPGGCLLIFVLAYRPYRQLRENIRSAVNIVAILGWLALRVLIRYCYPTYNQVSQYAFILCFLNMMLTFIVVLVALGFLIYQIVYICYLRQKQQNNQREKVMCELEELNVRQKMIALESKGAVFKQLMNPKLTLLDYSNFLVANKNENPALDDSAEKISAEKSEIDDCETSSRKIRKQMEKQKLVKEYATNDVKQQAKKKKQYVNKIQMQLEWQQDIPREEKEQKAKLVYAMEVLEQQNTWIRLKHARDYTHQKMKQFKKEETKDLLNQYQQIL